MRGEERKYSESSAQLQMAIEREGSRISDPSVVRLASEKMGSYRRYRNIGLNHVVSMSGDGAVAVLRRLQRQDRRSIEARRSKSRRGIN